MINKVEDEGDVRARAQAPSSSGKVGASIPLFQFATAKPFARPKALAHASGGAPLR
jgi:hypothetical protein